MPLFSVIIPVHNRTELLRATLGSVCEQECQDYELIVVDDGSSEDVAAAVAPYRDRLHLVRQCNRGPGAARNRGIKRATGQYVAFLDSDDLWFPWTLSVYRQAIVECGEPAFVAGDAVQITEASELARVARGAARFRRFDNYLATARQRLWVGTCGAVIRREQLVAVGGFVERQINAEDSDLWLRLGTAAGFVHIESPPVFGYRRHAQSAVTNTARCYAGICHLLEQERQGRYPGGAGGRSQRRRILSAHARPLSLTCLRENAIAQGWHIYRATLAWHLREGRFRYLAAFPIAMAWRYLRFHGGPTFREEVTDA